MKCRADAQVRESALNAFTRVYGVRCLEAIQAKSALLLLDTWAWFRHGKADEADRLRMFFAGQEGAITGMLAGSENDRVWITDRRRGRREADKYEKFEETVNDAEFRLTRALGWEGIDAAQIYDLAEASLPKKVFLPTDALHLDMRINWYGWLGRRAVRTWLAAAGISMLSMRYPSGRRRFPIAAVEKRFLWPLAIFAAEWLEEFFAGHDREQERDQKMRIRRLDDVYHVEIAPVSEQDKRMELGESGSQIVRKAAESKPAAQEKELPEDFGKILADVQGGFHYYVGTGAKPR